MKDLIRKYELLDMPELVKGAKKTEARLNVREFINEEFDKPVDKREFIADSLEMANEVGISLEEMWGILDDEIHADKLDRVVSNSFTAIESTYEEMEEFRANSKVAELGRRISSELKRHKAVIRVSLSSDSVQILSFGKGKAISEKEMTRRINELLDAKEKEMNSFSGRIASANMFYNREREFRAHMLAYSTGIELKDNGARTVSRVSHMATRSLKHVLFVKPTDNADTVELSLGDLKETISFSELIEKVLPELELAKMEDMRKFFHVRGAKDVRGISDHTAQKAVRSVAKLTDAERKAKNAERKRKSRENKRREAGLGEARAYSMEVRGDSSYVRPVPAKETNIQATAIFSDKESE